jgi:hypothetical protein
MSDGENSNDFVLHYSFAVDRQPAEAMPTQKQRGQLHYDMPVVVREYFCPGLNVLNANSIPAPPPLCKYDIFVCKWGVL